MQFQKYSPFLHHIKAALEASTGSVCYGVFGGSYFDRQYLSQVIINQIFKDFQPIKIDSAFSLSDALAPSLFDTKQKVYLVDGVTGPLHELCDLCAQFPVVFLAERIDKPLYDKLKKQAVWLDLTREKPWEKQQRLMLFVDEVMQSNNKQVGRDVLQRLVEGCGDNTAYLMQEVEKLVLYTADRRKVLVQDVEEVCQSVKLQKGWEVAAAVSFGWEVPAIEVDVDRLFALLGQVRYFLNIGHAICAAYEENLPLPSYPSIPQNTFAKYQKSAVCFGSVYFQAALCELTKMDFHARTLRLSPDLLWIRFLGRIRANRL